MLNFTVHIDHSIKIETIRIGIRHVYIKKQLKPNHITIKIILKKALNLGEQNNTHRGTLLLALL